jgi:F420-0:gamma-glutamyl ligase
MHHFGATHFEQKKVQLIQCGKDAVFMLFVQEELVLLLTERKYALKSQTFITTRKGVDWSEVSQETTLVLPQEARTSGRTRGEKGEE